MPMEDAALMGVRDLYTVRLYCCEQFYWSTTCVSWGSAQATSRWWTEHVESCHERRVEIIVPGEVDA